MERSSRRVVDRYYEAMQRGRAAEDDLVDLFSRDGIYATNLLGERQELRGRDRIRAWLAGSWEQAPPEMRLTVDEVEMDADGATVRWTCTSPAFPAPVRGTDRFVIGNQEITRLETTLREG